MSAQTCLHGDSSKWTTTLSSEPRLLGTRLLSKYVSVCVLRNPYQCNFSSKNLTRIIKASWRKASGASWARREQKEGEETNPYNESYLALTIREFFTTPLLFLPPPCSPGNEWSVRAYREPQSGSLLARILVESLSQRRANIGAWLLPPYQVFFTW